VGNCQRKNLDVTAARKRSTMKGNNLEGRVELQWLDLEGRERNCGGENIWRPEMRWLDRTWDFGTKHSG
jgi:hypothetical protein